MKAKIFILTLLSLVCFSVGICYADDDIGCGRKTISYNDDGSVTLKYEGDEEGITYNSLNDMYMSLYGFVPPLTLEESGYKQMFNISSTSHNSSIGSNKTRGRLIYSVQEANEVTKEGTVNRVRLRYK